MPLMTSKVGDCRGIERDGSKSEKWCSLCYLNGEFLDPECTVDQMIEIVDGALRKDHAGFVMRQMALKQIPTLERWRSK